MRSGIHGAAAAAAVGVLVVTAGGWVGYRQLTGPTAPARSSWRWRWRASSRRRSTRRPPSGRTKGAAVDGTCIDVTVAASEPVEVAAVVAAKHGATLAGVGQASGTAVSPDVWIPDSSTWLLRLKTGGAAAFEPGNGASDREQPGGGRACRSRSPPGSAGRRRSWAGPTCLNRVNSDRPLKTGIVEPTRDAAGLSGLLSLMTAASSSGGATAEQDRVGALRALASGASALRQDLLAKFPTSSDGTTLASALGAAALSEEDVIQYNATQASRAVGGALPEAGTVAAGLPVRGAAGYRAGQGLRRAGAVRGAHHGGRSRTGWPRRRCGRRTATGATASTRRRAHRARPAGMPPPPRPRRAGSPPAGWRRTRWNAPSPAGPSPPSPAGCSASSTSPVR